METKSRLASADLARLIKFCGMLGSAHVGERAAAGLMADQLLRQHNLRWNDVLAAPALPPPPPPDPPPVPPWQRAAAACLARPDRLSAWEAAFVAKIATYAHSPTEKQLNCLAAVLARVLA